MMVTNFSRQALSALTVAVTLVALPAETRLARAQEAITLERIGAVRMAGPSEATMLRQQTPATPTYVAVPDTIMLERIGAVSMSRPEEAAAHATTASIEDSVPHLWYTGAHGTAYYEIDQKARELVVTIEPGPAGGERQKIRRPLAEGHAERVVLSREKTDRLVVTLAVTRVADAYHVAITTQPALKLSSN